MRRTWTIAAALIAVLLVSPQTTSQSGDGSLHVAWKSNGGQGS
ncbi:hypothetical protein [Lentzea sp. NPDC051838]